MSNTKKSENAKTSVLSGISQVKSEQPTEPKLLTIDDSLALCNEKADELDKLVAEHIKLSGLLNKSVARFVRFRQVMVQLRRNCLVK